jgi:hypothetical protein
MPSLRFAAPFAAILGIRARRERQWQTGIVAIRACVFVLRRLVRLWPRLMSRIERCRIAGGEAALPRLVRRSSDRGTLT